MFVLFFVLPILTSPINFIQLFFMLVNHRVNGNINYVYRFVLQQLVSTVLAIFTIQGTSSKVTLVEMPALQEIKSRLDLSKDLRPPTPGHLTTLRIKSELGDQMYVLKMKHTETIEFVYAYCVCVCV